MKGKNQSGVPFVMRDGSPIQNLRIGGKGSDALIANDGNINANDTKDLLVQIGKLFAAAETRQIVKAPARAEIVAERRALLASASNNAGEWDQLGVQIAAQLNEARQRSGFIRQLCVEETLSNGQKPEHRMKYPNVVAVLATGAATVSSQLVRDKYFYPPEFTIFANIEVDDREIAQATGDILEEKYQEGLEATMVQEDRLWRQLADASVGIANPLTVISGQLTPTYLTTLASQVQAWNLPVTKCLLSHDFWKDIASNTDFIAAFDPISQNEILLTGRLGQLYGMELLTDGFRPPEQKVLEAGELYVVADAEYHGAMTGRGGVQPTPTNGHIHGKATKGWAFAELFSLAIVNAKSVAKGRRA